MPKCWCVLLSLVACWLGGSRAAHAGFAATPSTVQLGSVATSTPTIVVTPGPLQFNGVGVGEISATMHVTATNNGTAVLKITSAFVINTPSNYVVAGTSGAQDVGVGGHADWDIACKPAAMGTVDDAFRITSNAAGSPSDVTLKCTGQQGTLTVSNSSLDFGSVALADSKLLSVTLTNTGNVAITGIVVAIDNMTVGYSVVAGTVPAMLPASGTATVMVKFAPTTAADGATSHLTFSGTWTVGSAHTTTASAITLTGKTIGLTLSTQAIDFGDFRYDSAPKKTFNLKNEGTSDVSISSITMTPDAGTATTELPFTITLDGAPANLANPLPANHQYVVEITASPANRTGAIGGKFFAVSAGVALAPIVVKGNSTAAVIQTTDANFGAVDIQGAPSALTAVIKNTTADTASLDVSAVTIMATQGTAGVFSFTLPGAKTLGPGMTTAIPVTYKPTVERASGDADKVVLIATLTGALDGPRAMMITLSGRGIDRDLVLPAAAPAFPSTFRNPGDAAPIVPVTIQNSGEATLNVTAVMSSGAPVWQLLDAAPVDVPGGTSHDFMVKFAPTDVGPASQGQLSFQTNDTRNQAAVILLDGTGVPRNVQFGPVTAIDPPAINIGVTGANGEVTSNDALAVVSMDPSATFQIHEIQLDAGSPFRIVDAPHDQALSPMATARFAVALAPTAVGHFETTATLYLDQDPVPHAQVLLVGDAVAIDVGGGGGCDAGAGGGGVIVVLGAVLALRRRRAGVAVVIVVAVATGPGRAVADDVRAGAFDATPATTGAGVVVQAANVGADGTWVATSVASYATNLVVAHVVLPSGVEQASPLSAAGLLELGGAYAFLGRFEAGATVPLFMLHSQVDHTGGVALPGADGTVLGDLVLHGKAHLFDAGPLAIGAALHVTLPTAGGPFIGADLPTARVLGLASFAPNQRWSLSVNAGAILRKTADYRQTIFVEQGSGLAWGAGASVQLTHAMFATGELFGELVPRASQMSGSVSPVEGLLGVSYRGAHGVAIGVAGGAGLNAALGAPDFRGTVSLSFTSGETRDVREVAVVAPPVVLDRDGDGIPDAEDRCPDQAEDKDGFEDSDGCPDLDNDGDGIADAQDRCPDQAETFNGIDDDDGCPELAAAIDIDPAKPARQAAEETFARGRERLAQKDYLAACAAFEQSYRFDPAAGTRYNLATCDAELGKLATAAALFGELASSDKNAERRAISAQRVTELAPRVPRLKLVWRDAVPGARVTLNGADHTALVGTEAPVDLGVYTVEATAPGRQAWRGMALVRREGEVVTVEIKLEPAR